MERGVTGLEQLRAKAKAKGWTTPTAITLDRAAMVLRLDARELARMVKRRELRTTNVGGHKLVTLAEIRRVSLALVK